MPERILIDTSFLFSLYHSKAKYHQSAIQFALKNKADSLVPIVTLPEITFLIERDIGHYAIEIFLAKFAESQVQLEGLTLGDLKRAREVMVAYAKAELDLVDCCIMALAERLNITKICTFDRRDFSMVRPKHTDYFELLPSQF